MVLLKAAPHQVRTAEGSSCALVSLSMADSAEVPGIVQPGPSVSGQVRQSGRTLDRHDSGPTGQDPTQPASIKRLRACQVNVAGRERLSQALRSSGRSAGSSPRRSSPTPRCRRASSASASLPAPRSTPARLRPSRSGAGGLMDLTAVGAAAVGATVGIGGTWAALRRDRREERTQAIAEAKETIELLKEQTGPMPAPTSGHASSRSGVGERVARPRIRPSGSRPTEALRPVGLLRRGPAMATREAGQHCASEDQVRHMLHGHCGRGGVREAQVVDVVRDRIHPEDERRALLIAAVW